MNKLKKSAIYLTYYLASLLLLWALIMSYIEADRLSSNVKIEKGTKIEELTMPKRIDKSMMYYDEFDNKLKFKPEIQLQIDEYKESLKEDVIYEIDEEMRKDLKHKINLKFSIYTLLIFILLYIFLRNYEKPWQGLIISFFPIYLIVIHTEHYWVFLVLSIWFLNFLRLKTLGAE